MIALISIVIAGLVICSIRVRHDSVSAGVPFEALRWMSILDSKPTLDPGWANINREKPAKDYIRTRNQPTPQIIQCVVCEKRNRITRSNSLGIAKCGSCKNSLLNPAAHDVGPAQGPSHSACKDILLSMQLPMSEPESFVYGFLIGALNLTSLAPFLVMIGQATDPVTQGALISAAIATYFFTRGNIRRELWRSKNESLSKAIHVYLNLVAKGYSPDRSKKFAVEAFPNETKYLSQWDWDKKATVCWRQWFASSGEIEILTRPKKDLVEEVTFAPAQKVATAYARQKEQDLIEAKSAMLINFRNRGYSFSSLKTFTQCREKFKHRYCISTNENPSNRDAANYGRAIHAAASDFLTSRSDARDFNLSVRRTLTQNYSHLELPSHHKKVVANLDLFLTGLSGKVSSELKFESMIANNHKVMGYIDIVSNSGNQIEVIDLKTGKERKSRDFLTDSDQVIFYVLALQQSEYFRLSNATFSAGLFYAQTGNFVQFEVGGHEGVRVQDAVNEIIASIESEKAFSPTTSPLCSYCEYSESCSVGGEHRKYQKRKSGRKSAA